MAQVEAIEPDLEKFIVPTRYYHDDVAAGKADLAAILRNEGISLEDAVEIIMSCPQGAVRWENQKNIGQGFYTHFTSRIKQEGGKYIESASSRHATADEIIETLHAIQDMRVDRRKSWLDKAGSWIREAWREIAWEASFLAALGAVSLGVYFLHDDTQGMLGKTPEPYKLHAVIASDAGNSAVSAGNKASFSGAGHGMIAKASLETGVIEAVFYAMASFGNSESSKILRDKGYIGFIPVDPAAAGAVPEMLENNDYFSLLAFADAYRQIRNNVCDDETAVAVYLTSQEEVIKAKVTAASAARSLEHMDATDNQQADERNRIIRLFRLSACARSGIEPDKSLFEDFVRQNGEIDQELMENHWREIYANMKGLAMDCPKHSYSHHSYLSLRHDSLRIDRPERIEERNRLIAESAWFANLPEYASSVIAGMRAVHGGSK